MKPSANMFPMEMCLKGLIRKTCTKINTQWITAQARKMVSRLAPHEQWTRVLFRAPIYVILLTKLPQFQSEWKQTVRLLPMANTRALSRNRLSKTKEQRSRTRM